MPKGRNKTADAGSSAGEAVGDGADSGSSAQAEESTQGAGARQVADLEFVKALIEAVDASGIDSVEITRAGTRVKISKTPPAGPAAHAPAPGYYAAPGPFAGPAAPPTGGNAGAQPAAAPAPDTAPGGADDAAPAGGGDGLVEVKSPMVGTFYRAPAPEAPPYVEVGSRVSKGQTLCILEAMKLMNELDSEVEGVVRQVLVENSEPVEYGQVLFRIDPHG